MTALSPRLLDLSLTSPEENLALDEALLLDTDAALHGGGGAPADEWLRFWESPRYFVVIGVSGKLDEEVHVDLCRRLGIPILRRASGGGTVVQGPGCLNFSLVLSLEDRPRLRDLRASYRYILEQTASGLGAETRLRGVSDLTIGEDKISGNAQKRMRHALLHHGTILYNFDVALVERLLRMPAQEPEYRRQRSHADFLRNIPLDADRLRGSITAAWNATAAACSLPDLGALIETKYGNPAWTERF